MRTIEVKLYQFEELSNEAKENAIEENRTMNVEHDWWDWFDEGMNEIGIKVNSFDVYYGNIGITIDDSEQTAIKAIEKYPKENEVFKISKQFIADRDALVKRLGEGNNIDGYSVKEEFINEYDEEIEHLEEQYRREIAKEIITWLREDYEYLQTDEAIAETLIANDYEFTEGGTIY